MSDAELLKRDILDGNNETRWGCGCGHDSNHARRIKRFPCGRDAPQRIRQRALAEHRRLAAEKKKRQQMANARSPSTSAPNSASALRLRSAFGCC